MKNQDKYPNLLLLYRHRLKFSQEYVAKLLGPRSTSMLSRYESGQSLPPLLTAFCLAIVLRVPLEFLYLPLYRSLQGAIREQESGIRYSYQLTLF